MIYRNFFIIFFVCIGSEVAYTQIAVFPLHFRSPLESNFGFGWPHILHVASGHDALLKLTRSLTNQQSCTIRTPQGQTFNTNTLPSNRFESWGDGCGVRIKNITVTDEGRWRLTSTRNEDVITGYSRVNVIEATSNYSTAPITMEDGVANAQIKLTTLNNYYCMVAQPFAQSSLVPGQCQMTLEKTSRAVQGVWKVQLGLPGQVSELQIERHISVAAEHLDVGYIHDTSKNKLHLYCNILYGQRNISFCRFQRTSSPSGYNVIDGLSDGSHSYYGDGFIMKHCGMTVEQPVAEDFGTWRCSVGVQELVETNVVQHSPMQALISVFPHGISASDVKMTPDTFARTQEEKTVFAQIDTIMTLNCQANVSLSYCWYQHPNGSQFTPGQKLDDPDVEQLFWNPGNDLDIGDCSISFSHVTEDFSGFWTCHMGSSTHIGIEHTDRINVRVTGPLVAHKQEVPSTLHGSTELHCHTTGVARPISYCRFVSPSRIGFNLDTSIGETNAIFGRYYFSQDKSLDRGDCSLTIDPVLPADIGTWTCAALVLGQNSESRDYVQVYALEPNRSAASVAGIVIGTIVLASVIIVSLVYSYKKGLFKRSNNNLERLSVQELAARNSTSSGSSTESIS